MVFPGASVSRILEPSRKGASVPVIQCDIREGRTEEQKRALAREITRVVHETIGAPVEYIYVLIREQPGRHHIKGGKHLPEYESGDN
jgi:4-oxalocrotonate tautomerase family enzyme